MESLSFPNPPRTAPSSQPTSPTLPGGLEAVQQARVNGSTTTTLPVIGPGNASLNGSVLGPGGAVGGATVEVDRIVDSAVASTRTTTAADGSWSIPGILGGRYRVRAWQSPALAMTDPQILYLEGGQSRTLTLQLKTFTGPDIATASNPTAMFVGDVANLLVLVTNPTVGSDGVVRNQPAAGVSVTLTNGPTWTAVNGNPLNTGPDGTVVFQISCQQPGGNPLSVTIGAAAPVPAAVPSCSEPPPPTTACQTTTTTTRASVPPLATTTTEPPSGC